MTNKIDCRSCIHLQWITDFDRLAPFKTVKAAFCKEKLRRNHKFVYIRKVTRKSCPYYQKHVKAFPLELPEGPAILFLNTRKHDKNEHTNRRGNSSPTTRA